MVTNWSCKYMLINFFVENFLSFDQETNLNLLATTKKEFKEHVIAERNLNVLCSAALYGANASGKSNLVKAIAFAQDLILMGTKPDQFLKQNYFKLNKNSKEKPSRFEFMIFTDSKIFQYSFSLINTKICEEWLYVKENVRFVKYFERVVLDDGSSNFEFGKSFTKNSSKSERQFFEFIMKGTRKNQLFLTESIEKNITALRPLYNWFKNTLDIISPESNYALLPVRVAEDKNFVKFLCQLLQKFSDEIVDIRPSEVELDIDEQFPHLPEEIKDKIFQDINDGIGVVISKEEQQNIITKDEQGNFKLQKLKTRHKIKDSEEFVEFDIEDESDGTRRFMHLVPALINLHKQPKVMIIDELDRRLHPLLSKSFLKLYFLNRNKNSQLIFTTHDASLLSADLLRRDEIWFFEKDQYGASHLISLAEFKVRDDLNLQKGYLSGRFGAIPIMGSPELSKIMD